MDEDRSDQSNTSYEEGELRQGPKSEVQRQLRQEANFGCAVCGTPVLEYHHIIPESEVEHYDPDHMIALCPTHHRPSDDEAITRDRLYKYKENPHITDYVDHVFYFEPTNPKIILGSSVAELYDGNDITLLNINGKDIIDLSFEDNLLRFSIRFYSKDDELVAQITDNDWWAKSNEVWDLQSKSHWFKLYNKDEELGVKLEHAKETSQVNIEGKFQYNGHRVEIYPSSIQGPNSKQLVSISMSVDESLTDAIFIYAGDSEILEKMARVTMIRM